MQIMKIVYVIGTLMPFKPMLSSESKQRFEGPQFANDLRYFSFFASAILIPYRIVLDFSGSIPAMTAWRGGGT